MPIIIKMWIDTDTIIICKEHGKPAKYCQEEMRWICEDCEPERMGTFKTIQGVLVEDGDK